MDTLIKFKRKFVIFKREVDSLNQKLYFYKDVLMSMINNLSYCNNLKIFQESDMNNFSILNELKEIKDEIDELPDIINFKYLKTNKLTDIIKKIQTIKI
jgi:hypothetical protein